MTKRLVEREAELDAHLDGAVHTGRGSVVVLAGEAGCGKTALLQAFVDRALDRVEVRCGSCDRPARTAHLRALPRRRRDRGR